MESLIEPVLKLVSFIGNFVSRQISYARDLDRKKNALSRKADELRHRRDEIQAQVQVAVSVGKTKLRQVENWLEDADDILRDVASIESDSGQGGSCFNGRCPDLRWRLKLGKKIEKKMKVVEQLLQKGIFDSVAESPRRPQMPEFPVTSQLEQQSTSQETLQEIEKALDDEEIGVVSVCGMGGIGKTTLMQKIYNSFAERGDFQVIWVTVSKDLNLEVIQKEIGKELEVEFHDDEGIEDKRRRLHGRLRNVKFMLILDDLWEAFSLDQVGIPRPDTENGCKISITTRLISVTSEMEAHNEIRAKTIHMKTLTSGEAWDLFYIKAGDAVLLPTIKPVAKKIVKECGGLPLAIQTVGAAMRGKYEESLWENALRSLKGSAPEVRGMERRVFLPLKLSYDSLEDSSTKFCFLYCALFPEDYPVDTNWLVKYWVLEEAWTDKFDRVEEALNKGHDILYRLKDACLLESAKVGHVKMHDLLRDLAIWITSQSSSPSSKFLVKSGLGLRHPPEEKYWEGVGRISLMSNHIQDLQIIPNSPDLISLFLGNNRGLQAIHSGFFEQMPQLRILDLGRTGIRSLPPSLSHLVNLRALILNRCQALVEIPPLGELEELQLLYLSYTAIKELPEGISNLVKLKQLDLSYANALNGIPCNLISVLTCLEDLNLCGTEEVEVATWREVTALPRLLHLKITVPDLNGFTAHDIGLLGSLSNLKRFRIYLGRQAFGGTDFKKENLLSIDGCRNFPGRIERGIVSHVESLVLSRCNPACLSQQLGYAKSLRKMRMHDCKGVECIIDWRKTEDSNALDCLTNLDLHKLPHLESIFVGEPPLPSTCFQRLQEATISECPKLRCVFSSSMVGPLHQLKYLRVSDCGVECIIDWRKMEDSNALDCLTNLDLHKLPHLENIFVGGPPLPSTCFQRLQEATISECPKLRCVFMVGSLHQLKYLRVSDCGVECILDWRKTEDSNALDCLTNLDLYNLPHLKNIFDGGPPLPSVCFQRLEEATISKCPKLRCVFSSSMVGHLHQLKYLRVHDCEGVECIIDWRKTEDSNALDCLTNLDLHNMPHLENIFDGGPSLPSTRFQRLQEATISDCPKLRCVFPSSMVGHLHQLQRLTVANCEGVEEIVQGDMLPEDAFQRLSFLHLSNLPKLSSICRAVLKSLEEIRVDVCPELKKLPPLCSAIQGIEGWVEGQREWWEGMEWGDDDHSKSIYSTMFTQQGPLVQTVRRDEAAHIYESINAIQPQFLPLFPESGEDALDHDMLSRPLSLLPDSVSRDDGAAHSTQPLYFSLLPGRGDDESVNAVQPHRLSLFPGEGEDMSVYATQSLSPSHEGGEDELVHDMLSRPLPFLPGTGEDESVHAVQPLSLSLFPGRAEDELIHDISSRPLSILPGGGEDVSVHTIQPPMSVLLGRGEDELIHDILSRPLSTLPGT